MAAAEILIPQLASQVDLLILSHLGWSQNVQLADQFAEVDLIVGGGAEAASGTAHRSAATGTYLVRLMGRHWAMPVVISDSGS